MLSYTRAAAVISAVHMHLYCFVQASVADVHHLHSATAADRHESAVSIRLLCVTCTSSSSRSPSDVLGCSHISSCFCSTSSSHFAATDTAHFCAAAVLAAAVAAAAAVAIVTAALPQHTFIAAAAVQLQQQ
jgi:hypothetical protein